MKQQYLHSQVQNVWEASDMTLSTSKSLQVDCLDHCIIVCHIITHNHEDSLETYPKVLVKCCWNRKH
jgi:hypothetical protein